MLLVFMVVFLFGTLAIFYGALEYGERLWHLVAKFFRRGGK